MVRISEVHELEDDPMERLNLDDYNSDDFDEYLSDNMETTPTPRSQKPKLLQSKIRLHLLQ